MRGPLSVFVCPKTHTELREVRDGNGALIRFESETGLTYPVTEGLLDLTFPRELDAADRHARAFYDARADAYDKFLHLTFLTHNENEEALRNRFIDQMQFTSGGRVLDLACGTGRDSILIAHRLDRTGEIYLQDISAPMLKRCRQRLAACEVGRKKFCIANAVYLPYPDNYFDSVYSFGGLGEFSDIRHSLQEMVRVTRVGGKVVIGDESIPVWLRNTEFAKILMTTNPQFKAEVPLKDMPLEARDVCLRWVIGGVFYLIDFRVGEGEPKANFDFDIPGVRGGTYRTRYEGQLEGVTLETKRLAELAREKTGLSMHKWLDDAVRRAAHEELDTK